MQAKADNGLLASMQNLFFCMSGDDVGVCSLHAGHADVCELLLDAGADVDATDSAGRTTLQASAVLLRKIIIN